MSASQYKYGYKKEFDIYCALFDKESENEFQYIELSTLRYFICTTFYLVRCNDKPIQFSRTINYCVFAMVNTKFFVNHSNLICINLWYFSIGTKQ